jgi:succinate dehydrogenase/fumarate reductase flavoprotein subunit
MPNPNTITAARPELGADGNGVSARADVLVIGGGPAGCWAAITAAEYGASVVLVDKGYCGTSGATASAGTGVWYVEPDADAREEAIQSREAMGGWLVDRRWMHRVLDKTYEQMNRLAEWGYPFPVDEDGKQVRRGVQGPEYMRRMRKLVVRSRVRILDQSPALELLCNSGGEVVGARGVRRQRGDAWTVHSGAVVVASGGCAFLSGGLGCDVLTGDGSLMAAEAGAEFSGMEFSNAYAISPTFSTVTKTAFYRFATFYTDEGLLEGAGAQRGRSVIAKALLRGPVYAQLDQAPARIERNLRDAQPNFFLPFDREEINPFTQRFPVTLRLEGTVRGTGGLRLTDNQCATTVPGLYAAGDAATRELICGGFTGGGSHNAAWALSSGTWAGEGAAAYAAAKRGAAEKGEGIGVAGLNPTSAVDKELTSELVTKLVHNEVHPYDKNYFRTEAALEASLANLDDLWDRVEAGLHGGDGYPPYGEESAAALFRAREAAAMVAHARWMYNAAHERTETRGMHKRSDHPELDPAQQQRRFVGGLAEVWNGLDPVKPYSILGLAK